MPVRPKKRIKWPDLFKIFSGNEMKKPNKIKWIKRFGKHGPLYRRKNASKT